MAIVKTAILLEQGLFQRAEEYLHRQENLALLEKLNASHDGTDPETERFLKASQRAFRKVQDEW